jgi:transcriptional regulator with XRE-family HTH domain
MAVSTIKERIKAVRTALNLSQKDFCKGIFISQSLYAKIETGERKPTERIYELISNKYKVNKDWIMTGRGDMFSIPPPDVELEQLLEIIRGLDPLFRDYIIQQIKQLANLHRQSKEQGQTPAPKGKKPQ